MGVSVNLAQNAQAIINLATASVSTVPLSNSNVVLTAIEVINPIIEFMGVLTTNVVVTVPTSGTWKFYNGTSGAFTVTLSNGTGATLVVSPGTLTEVVSSASLGILGLSGGGTQGPVVQSFNTRTGAVTLQASDVSGVGGALLVSPSFTGTPTAPTPAAGNISGDIATTAFVAASYAPLNSPALTGVPTAPTVSSTSDNSSKIATTAFVQEIVSTIVSGLNYVGTWNASTNTPTLTSGVGTKSTFYKVSVAGTTNLDGNATWNVGDIALFDGAHWDYIGGQPAEVISFNTRSGAITLTSNDVTTALGFTPAPVGSYAPLVSPAFTGVPTAPTPAAGNNSTDIATTAFVASSYAPLSSPALVGIPTAPTAPIGTSTGQLATTAFVISNVGSYAPINSPTFTGVPAAPTANPGTSSTQVATTAFVETAISGFAPLVSPAFIGTPTAPTQLAGNSSTNIATTAFVANSLASFAPIASPVLTGRAQSDAYSYTVNALGNVSGTVTLNLSVATEWSMTITGNTTFAFTNTLASTASQIVCLRLTNAGASQINWPANTKFAAKTPPVFTSAGLDLLGVMYDQPTGTYMVFVMGLNVG